MSIKNLLFLILICTSLLEQQKENNRSFYNVLKNQRGLISALFLIIGSSICYIKKTIEEEKKEKEKLK